MNRFRILQFTWLLVALPIALVGGAALADETPDRTLHVKGFDLPQSSLLSAESKAVLERVAKEREEYNKLCPPQSMQDVPATRECQAKHRYPALLARHKARYPVVIEPQAIAGVPTEIITPAEGVSEANRQRVLINVHGGAFVTGGRWGGQVESIPIASVGKYKVVAIDYRMAPEHQFPAASEDVAAVYRELLKTYEARNIGLYGCSAGGVLTAQATAWIASEGLPLPGAIGMFCAAATYWGYGDSGYYSAALTGRSASLFTDPRENPYLENADFNDPLVFPARSRELLQRFPPSLLIASTRDLAFSSVVDTHSKLVALGKEAQLNVWEGLDHAFFFEPDLPQSREVYDVTVKFFDRHLGQVAPAPDTAKLEASLAAEVEKFVQTDRLALPSPCGIVFVGSSSFVKWDTMKKDMAPLPAINRGFGGSHIEYVNRWFDQLVVPYKPRAIVFYAGENDIGAGKPVQQVVADFDAFMAKKDAALGKTPVYFISVKPSKLRFWQLKLQNQVNAAVRERAKQRADLHYIDVASAMLQGGKPKDLFVADDLHMSPAGYAIWTKAVKAAIAPQTETQARECRRSK